MKSLLALLLLLISTIAIGQINQEYQKPPKEITAILEAPKTPSVYISPDKNNIILFHRPNYPSIEELAQPENRLAGLRINPRTNGSSRSYFFNGISVIKMENPSTTEAVHNLPKSLKIENIHFSPDSKKIAFTNTVSNGMELWYIDLLTLKGKKLSKGIINDAISGTPYEWLPNSKQIIFKSVLDNRGEIPKKPLVPKGPIIQENIGSKAPVRTFQDLLQNKYDEDLFEYFTSSELFITDLEGNHKKLNFKGIISDFSISPDGQYILTENIQKPFSYLVPYYRFSTRFEIIDINGKLVKTLADIPASEDIPKGYSAVRKGPRSYTWRADVPSTIYWAVALDEGNPKKEVDYRDQVFFLESPFTGKAKSCFKINTRFGGIQWFDENIAIVSEWWWDTRMQKTSFFKPNAKNGELQVLFEKSWEDAYNDPGTFVTKINESGKRVLLSDKSKTKLYLRGNGASPEGNKPFIDEFPIKTRKTKRLWRSEAPYYEYPHGIIDLKKQTILTSRESKEEQPNFFIRNLKNNKLLKITNFKHPYPQLKGIESELVKYKRADGVQLTGKLYLPKGYKKGDKKLPVLMWAYPTEYKSADAAGQVKDSPHRFIRTGWWSPLLWLTQGYAIFDDPAMPIIGEGNEEPNDKFREQLVANAKAAIDTLVAMGVADEKRIAIGGHSYGAFMTANLMAHSDLFAAGIARSGAYNRTLTPFGFQSEQRTFWEAKETYIEMSPFTYADKVNEPLLIIHGEADNNSGTYPMQSERYYNALKGHGAITRLVMLPHESHGYRAKESILHMAWEMNLWLKKYVKGKSTKTTEKIQN